MGYGYSIVDMIFMATIAVMLLQAGRIIGRNEKQ